MRKSGAEGSEGRAKLRDERHSHVIREWKSHRQEARVRERETEIYRERQPAAGPLGHTQKQKPSM